MSGPRIVLDTNIIISAALKPTGLEAYLLELIATRLLHLFLSREVLAEYREVFSRPKFSGLDSKHVSHLLALIAQEATMVTPAATVFESPHVSDNRFLECAEAAQADFLVTGNKRHFPAQWKSARVVNARELLEELTNDRHTTVIPQR